MTVSMGFLFATICISPKSKLLLDAFVRFYALPYKQTKTNKQNLGLYMTPVLHHNNKTLHRSQNTFTLSDQFRQNTVYSAETK